MSSNRRDLVATLDRLAADALRRVRAGEDPFDAVVGCGLFRFHATIPVPFVARRPSLRHAARVYRRQARAGLSRLEAGESGDVVLGSMHRAWIPLAQACGLAGWGCPGTGTHPSLLSQFTALGPAGDAWITLARLGVEGMSGLLHLADELLEAAGMAPAPDGVDAYATESSALLAELMSVGSAT